MQLCNNEKYINIKLHINLDYAMMFYIILFNYGKNFRSISKVGGSELSYISIDQKGRAWRKLPADYSLIYSFYLCRFADWKASHIY